MTVPVTGDDVLQKEVQGKQFLNRLLALDPAKNKSDSNFNNELSSPRAVFVMQTCNKLVEAANIFSLRYITQTWKKDNVPGYIQMVVAASKLRLVKLLSENHLRVSIAELIAGLSRCVKGHRKNKQFATLYFGAIRDATNGLLSIQRASFAINFIIKGILWWTDGHPEHMTPAHTQLYCTCLKARLFWPVIPFLDLDIVCLFNEGFTGKKSGKKSLNMLLGPENLALHFYYLAIIKVSFGDIKEGLLELEHLLCMPKLQVTSISESAFAKAVLFAAAIGNDTLFLPRCNILGSLKHPNSCGFKYFDLAKVIGAKPVNESIAKAKQFLEERENDEDEKNMDSIRMVVQQLIERSILELASRYCKIREADAARFVGLAKDEFENTCLSMSSRNLLNVKINGETKIYEFFVIEPVADLNKIIDETSKMVNSAECINKALSTSNNKQLKRPSGNMSRGRSNGA